jgi:hypothetical protein
MVQARVYSQMNTMVSRVDNGVDSGNCRSCRRHQFYTATVLHISPLNYAKCFKLSFELCQVLHVSHWSYGECFAFTFWLWQVLHIYLLVMASASHLSFGYGKCFTFHS